MPSPTCYLLLNPSRTSHRLLLPSPRLPARFVRFRVSCDVPRQGSDGGGGPKRGVIPDGSGKGKKKQLVFFDAAPPVAQQSGGEEGKADAEAKKDGAALRLLRRTTRRTLSVLSNLPLAIGEMFAIAGLMALGTVFLLNRGTSKSLQEWIASY